MGSDLLRLKMLQEKDTVQFVGHTGSQTSLSHFDLAWHVNALIYGFRTLKQILYVYASV